MNVFKVAKCYTAGCTYRRKDHEKIKELPPCPKCGAVLKYMENWYYSYKHLGRKYIKAGGTQKRFAEDALAKARVQIRERKFFPHKVPETSWTSATKKFLEQVKTDVQPGTYKMYVFGVNQLTPYFKRLTLDQIGTADLESYKRERLTTTTRRGTSPAPGTINRELATIKRICAWATEQAPKLLALNVLGSVKKLKEGKGRVRFLTEDEIATLLSHCETSHLKMAVIIALETGLRKHGVLTLKWQDIQNGVITKTVKRGKVVYIPVTATLERALEDYRSASKVLSLSGYVIPSPKKAHSPMGVDSDIGFQTACKRATIEDFRFHDLRHTFASHFVMRTGDLKTLQELLGHSDMQMTQKYTHLLDTHKRKQMDLFDRARNGGSDG
jgi:integrase